ncbi:MAG TPA: TonB-dependent receptor, partial [Prolixibacteraceae bacterium]|nr:TonB-dependent receptor [Prolixibacteraceae bacterium]
MKKTILIFLLSTMVLAVSAQAKRKDQVKRKYQKAEQVNENLPLVQVHGRVLNVNREPLAGASITVPGTRLGVNANADGEYFLTGLPTGKVSIQASFVGYQTKVIDYYLQEGLNDVYFTLDQDDITLEPVMVTSQKREQQALDVPVTMNVIGSSLLEDADIRELAQLSDFVPGLNIRVQTPHRPSFVVRGMTSDEVSPNAQPRVSVYYNNVPTSRGSMALAELYDMERVEVLKGPQGTLFGRGSQIGVIHFLSKRPDQNSGGYLTAGMGDYGMKEIQGAVNIPIAENKLFARAAGIYSYRDGYVENTFGGTLNGKNTIGGRFSLRYLPFYNTKVDLVVNYQKDDEPGVAFMSKKFPNAQGVTDIFKYQASLEQGKNLKNNRDVLGSSLEIKHFRNEHNYLSSITSYYTNSANSRWDGDGTAAPAIDMAETADVKQFTQELRYNFSKGSRTNGSVGASYWREKVDQTYW